MQLTYKRTDNHKIHTHTKKIWKNQQQQKTKQKKNDRLICFKIFSLIHIFIKDIQQTSSTHNSVHNNRTKKNTKKHVIYSLRIYCTTLYNKCTSNIYITRVSTIFKDRDIVLSNITPKHIHLLNFHFNINMEHFFKYRFL